MMKMIYLHNKRENTQESGWQQQRSPEVRERTLELKRKGVFMVWKSSDYNEQNVEQFGKNLSSW